MSMKWQGQATSKPRNHLVCAKPEAEMELH